MSNIFEQWCETASADRSSEVRHIQMNAEFFQHICDESVDMFVCSCGKPQADTTLTFQKLKETGLCFECDFWKGVLTDTTTLVVERVTYVDGGNRPNVLPFQRQWLGFGGHVWKYRRHGSDEIVESNNLFHRGAVPDRFYTEDNAEFIKHGNINYTCDIQN